MQFTLQAIAALAFVASALPTAVEDASSEIAVRAEPGATTTWKCASRTFTAANITENFHEAGALSQKKATIKGKGGSPYPHSFGNKEKLHFPLCPSGAYLEFPIFPDGHEFSKKDKPEADRLVYEEKSAGVYKFCGLMTHDGAKEKNGFIECTSE